MTSEIRLLGAADRDALERFLEREADTTMFLRSNLAAAGLEYDGSTYSAQYVAAWRGGDIVGVAAHCWNGNLVLHAPGRVADVVQEAVRTSARRVAALLGPWAQLVEARAALDLGDAPTAMESRDILFALDLGGLKMPALLAHPDSLFVCRPGTADDLEILTEYRVAYSKEVLGARDSPDLAARCREEIMRFIGRGAWLLCERERPVACSFFNARTPDCVQVGGVYTPPELRGRGFGRAVVAGSLAAVRSEGVRRSILFTGEDNHAAQAAYRALGYESIGDYGLMIFFAE